ncbi:MAG: P-loop NTPase, partial [Longimicrobiales bacterium]
IGSGKGGVGKSALTANLAAALARRGRRVGALDADLNGPSLARMLGARPGRLGSGADAVRPAVGAAGVRVMSMDLLLESDDAPVRWREPAAGTFAWQSTLEAGVLREFLADIDWGALDLLLVDLPPGTDKLVRLLSFRRPDALLLVSTPSKAARFVVAKSMRQAREAGLVAVGLVVNMDGYACPSCGAHHRIWGEPSGESADAEPAGPEPGRAEPEMDVWGRVPFEPALAASTDAGVPWTIACPTSPAATAIEALADRLESALAAVEAP